jgi:serine/threonine-protein kinase
MGAVYDAVHEVTGKRLAVKLIGQPLGEERDELLARFRREARAAGVLETPHIVQIFDSGYDAGLKAPYIAMELCEGESLRQLLKRLGALVEPLALRIVGQACRGLAAAHRAGVVHRDIKPSNLFLCASPDGRRVVKILDFGIAKLDARLRDAGDTGELTATGALLGSPHYVSPEQVRRHGDVDHRTDIWSLGVVLFEALSAHKPHGEAANIMELLVRIYSERPRPLRKLAPWVSDEAAAVVERALCMAPSERWKDAGAMLAALEAIAGASLEIDAAMLEATAASARAGGKDVDGPGTTREATQTSTPGPDAQPKRSGGGSRTAAIGIAAAVAAAGALAYVAARVGSPDDATVREPPSGEAPPVIDARAAAPLPAPDPTAAPSSREAPAAEARPAHASGSRGTRSAPASAAPPPPAAAASPTALPRSVAAPVAVPATSARPGIVRDTSEFQPREP